MCHVSRAIESEFDGVVLATEMEQYAIVALSREMSSGLQLIEAVQKRPKTRSIPPRGSGVYSPSLYVTRDRTEQVSRYGSVVFLTFEGTRFCSTVRRATTQRELKW